MTPTKQYIFLYYHPPSLTCPISSTPHKQESRIARSSERTKTIPASEISQIKSTEQNHTEIRCNEVRKDPPWYTLKFETSYNTPSLNPIKEKLSREKANLSCGRIPNMQDRKQRILPPQDSSGCRCCHASNEQVDFTYKIPQLIYIRTN